MEASPLNPSSDALRQSPARLAIIRIACEFASNNNLNFPVSITPTSATKVSIKREKKHLNAMVGFVPRCALPLNKVLSSMDQNNADDTKQASKAGGGFTNREFNL